MSVCFLRRDRKSTDPNVRRRGEELGGVKGGETIIRKIYIYLYNTGKSLLHFCPCLWMAKLRIHSMGRHQTLTLLLMLCCACRQEPSMAVFWEALWAADWDRCRYLQLTEVRDPYGRVRGRIEGTEGMATTQEDQQCQLGPWGAPRD